MKKTKKTPKNKSIFDQKNISQQDFVAALENISKKLVYKFKFGYHSIEDMKQQAAIFAMEGLQNYDNSRPLENFLWTHVRNRLFNYKRDNYYRPDNVCASCPFFDPANKKSNNQCAKFDNKNDCDIYSQWTNRNSLKKNIMQPSNIENEYDMTNSSNFFSSISNKEIIDMIEDKIHTKYRESYLKLKSGNKISKQELAKLKTHIQSLIQDHV